MGKSCCSVKWKKIPKEVEDEIKYISDYTEKTGHEASITVCQKPKSKVLFVSNSARGDQLSTETPACDVTFGAAKRVADVHTHPVNANTIGILPSPSDFTSTLQDTYNSQNPLISCVTNHITPLTECYQPKRVPDQYQLWAYDRALKMSSQYDDNSFFIDNVKKDFNISFFDPHNGRQIKNPKPNQIVTAAFGESKDSLRKGIKELERAGFCLYIQSMTRPGDDRVQEECKRELKRRESWLGLPDLGL